MKLKNKLKTVAAKANNKSAPAKTGLHVLEAYSIAHLKKALSEGLDAAGAWLGKEIADPLATALISNREKISSTRLAKTDRVLFVGGPKKAFAWPLLGLSGDIYERSHDGRKPVRGMLSALQKAYGAKNVRIVSRQEAVKLLKTLKADPGVAKAFGIAA